MSRSLRCLLSFAGLVLLFAQCEYKPHLVYTRDIKKPDTAFIVVTLTPTDSVYTLYEPTWLYYDLRTFGLPVYSVAFFLDEDRIKDGTDTTGSVYIPYYQYQLGDHTLTMVVTTGSNSGSLADLLQAEGFIYSESWKVIFVQADLSPGRWSGSTGTDSLKRNKIRK